VSGTSPMASSSLPPLREDASILERYVDTLVGINFTNGIFNFTFATVPTPAAPEPTPVQAPAIQVRTWSGGPPLPTSCFRF
jgi:hypothetical protein